LIKERINYGNVPVMNAAGRFTAMATRSSPRAVTSNKQEKNAAEKFCPAITACKSAAGQTTANALASTLNTLAVEMFMATHRR
jgi:hypothetical protein